MNRRTVERVVSVKSIKLQLIGDNRDVDATLQDFSDGGACCSCSIKLELGAAIRLDLEDSLYLGEVVYCQKDGDGFRAGIQFQQCLGRISDLKRLVSALGGQRSKESSRTAA